MGADVNRRVAFGLRLLVTAFVFVTFVVASYLWGNWLHAEAFWWFLPDIGNPSTDPSGRGQENSADFAGIGPLVTILLGMVAAWLAWLATHRRNWTLEFFVSIILFIPFSVITVANYVRHDTVFTRDSQAVLNLFLVASAASLLVLAEGYIRKIRSVLIAALARSFQAISIFAFIALPTWFTLSYLSWKFGAGKLESMDAAAKAIAAVASLATVLGLTWKDGRLSFGYQNEASASSARIDAKPLANPKKRKMHRRRKL